MVTKIHWCLFYTITIKVTKMWIKRKDRIIIKWKKKILYIYILFYISIHSLNIIISIYLTVTCSIFNYDHAYVMIFCTNFKKILLLVIVPVCCNSASCNSNTITSHFKCSTKFIMYIILKQVSYELIQT